MLAKLVELNPLILFDDVGFFDIRKKVEPLRHKLTFAVWSYIEPDLPQFNARVRFDVVHTLVAVQNETSGVCTFELFFVLLPGLLHLGHFNFPLLQSSYVECITAFFELIVRNDTNCITFHLVTDVDGSQVCEVNVDVFEKLFEFFIFYFISVRVLVEELLDFCLVNLCSELVLLVHSFSKPSIHGSGCVPAHLLQQGDKILVRNCVANNLAKLAYGILLAVSKLVHFTL